MRRLYPPEFNSWRYYPFRLYGPVRYTWQRIGPTRAGVSLGGLIGLVALTFLALPKPHAAYAIPAFALLFWIAPALDESGERWSEQWRWGIRARPTGTVVVGLVAAFIASVPYHYRSYGHRFSAQAVSALLLASAGAVVWIAEYRDRRDVRRREHETRVRIEREPTSIPESERPYEPATPEGFTRAIAHLKQEIREGNLRFVGDAGATLDPNHPSNQKPD